MKYRWYLAMALSIGLITVGCVGCGNSTSSSKSNTSTAGEVTESIEEDTKDDSSEVEADTYTIKVTKVKKGTITGIVGEMGGTSGETGEMPSMEEGEMPSMEEGEMPSGGGPRGGGKPGGQMEEGEMPSMEEGEMPSMEEGQMPSMEESSENSDASGTTSEGQDKMDGGFPGGMNSQFSETDEKITVNVTDDTVFVDETGEGVESIDDIETGMILEVEVDEDGNAVTVTVVSTGKTSQQGGMDMGGKNKQASTEADKTEEDSDI